ncbi:hypothetical protein [Micromonospora inyonensis]|uniref:Uncharacterized protein n=1 Tax=Micromonospora inyonensis TaxID=47866 RepID=A0A1C6SVS5_9ACTN|nr:hypothetical protein [Micromonospora inyonensis]SCL14997.1 hypothetical protein GA0074694_1008 [Micromonospora inyonensis]SCL33422.1 hypothetical protein GA0074694_6224 [Micromonospora inyonensis]SCL33510.1 hypothetical protein GA0074694_6246 [Micromonospora inyonensis]
MRIHPSPRTTGIGCIGAGCLTAGVTAIEASLLAAMVAAALLPVGMLLVAVVDSYDRRLRAVLDEVRHHLGVIDMMAADIEADEERHALEVRQAYQRGRAEATSRALVEQERAVREAEARGYVAGVRKRLAEVSRIPRRSRPGHQRG